MGLVWDVLDDVETEYIVQLELLDEDGKVVVRVEGPPLEGNYPTSIWADGESVPDEHLLDLEGLPPGEYALRVSWLTEDGEPLLLDDGRSALELGPVFIE